jgi:hypothetical protein
LPYHQVTAQEFAELVQERELALVNDDRAEPFAGHPRYL